MSNYLNSKQKHAAVKGKLIQCNARISQVKPMNLLVKSLNFSNSSANNALSLSRDINRVKNIKENRALSQG